MQVRVSPYVTTTPNAGPGGEAVIANEASGAYFLADDAMLRFLDFVRRLGSIEGAGKALGLPSEVTNSLEQTLVENGVLISDNPHARHKAKGRKRPPLESRMLFFRVELFDLRPVLARLFPVLRLAFTPVAFALWVALIAYAGAVLVANAEQAFADLASLSFSSQTAVLLGALFLALKAVHELGHAAAYRVFCQAEALATGPIRAGVCFFACAPFPFTNVTGAWRLKSRMRRAVIGAAGVYVETFIAAIAVILWAGMTPGEFRTAALQLALISGVSTLVFNLNPLVRLDGYFIFSDLMGAPNLATRASMAARNVGLWLLGGAWRTAPTRRLIYWAASYSYRWVIFAGIFWIAYSIDPRLAVPVALIAMILLILRPIWSVLRSVSVKSLGFRGLTTLLLLSGAILAAALIPLPKWSTADGRLERFEDFPIYAPAPVVVDYVAPMGRVTSDIVVRFTDPLLVAEMAENALAKQRAALAIRAAGAVSPSAEKRMRQEMEAVQAQSERLAVRRSALAVIGDQGDVWSPGLVSQRQAGWVTPSDRELGVLSKPISPRIVAKLPQAERANSTLADGTTVQIKSGRHDACAFSAVVTASLSSASSDGFYEIKAGLPADAPECAALLPHGAKITMRLGQRDTPLINQVWQAAIKLAQARLPIS